MCFFYFFFLPAPQSRPPHPRPAPPRPAPSRPVPSIVVGSSGRSFAFLLCGTPPRRGLKGDAGSGAAPRIRTGENLGRRSRGPGWGALLDRSSTGSAPGPLFSRERDRETRSIFPWPLKRACGRKATERGVLVQKAPTAPPRGSVGSARTVRVGKERTAFLLWAPDLGPTGEEEQASLPHTLAPSSRTPSF